MKSKTGLKILAFLFAVLMAMGAGVLRNTGNKECYLFNFDPVTDKNITRTIDIGGQGLIKQTLQPSVITLVGRFKATVEHKELYASFEGFDSYVSQGRKKSIWPQLKETDKLNLRAKGNTPLNIELQIPRGNAAFYDVGKAKLTLSDGRQFVSTIEFLIVNSDAKK